MADDKLDVALAEGEKHYERSPMLAWDGVRVATICVLVADTVIMVMMFWFLVANVQSQRETNECYQNQADELLSAIIVGRQVTAQDRAAQLAMLNTILDPGANPETRRAAVDGWRQVLIQGDQTRSTAPLPTQRCAR